MNAIIPRDTVEAIVARRDRALDLYGRAHAALEAASEAVRAAGAEAFQARANNSFNANVGEEWKNLFTPLKIMPADQYLATARRLADVDAWARLIEMTNLERLMDKKAKDEFRRQLITDPPEATVENVFATLEQFMADAGTIFRRGIAECFSDLDRRFRSHDGWKIGSRIILDHAFDGFGSWNYYRNQRDTLHDVERVFFILDDRPPPEAYAGLVGAIEESRRGNYNARQSEAETEFFKARCWKNGNCHLWFKRDDLVEKVNRLLGEYYGAPIPEEREAAADDGLHNVKTTPAKNYGFFPTPDAAADALIESAMLYRCGGEPRLTVLEPSAGTGNLARRAAAAGAIVDCVEMQPDLAADLRSTKLYRRVISGDFLAIQPDPGSLYDRVVMNPPFDRERDVDHVMHALGFLKPGGYLTAIMSAGTEFRETKKSTAFRALMTRMNARWRDLPAGSFAEVGTYCNTIILRVFKDGRSFW